MLTTPDVGEDVQMRTVTNPDVGEDAHSTNASTCVERGVFVLVIHSFMVIRFAG